MLADSKKRTNSSPYGDDMVSKLCRLDNNLDSSPSVSTTSFYKTKNAKLKDEICARNGLPDLETSDSIHSDVDVGQLVDVRVRSTHTTSCNDMPPEIKNSFVKLEKLTPKCMSDHVIIEKTQHKVKEDELITKASNAKDLSDNNTSNKQTMKSEKRFFKVSPSKRRKVSKPHFNLLPKRNSKVNKYSQKMAKDIKTKVFAAIQNKRNKVPLQFVGDLTISNTEQAKENLNDSKEKPFEILMRSKLTPKQNGAILDIDNNLANIKAIVTSKQSDTLIKQIECMENIDATDTTVGTNGKNDICAKNIVSTNTLQIASQKLFDSTQDSRTTPSVNDYVNEDGSFDLFSKESDSQGPSRCMSMETLDSISLVSEKNDAITENSIDADDAKMDGQKLFPIFTAAKKSRSPGSSPSSVSSLKFSTTRISPSPKQINLLKRMKNKDGREQLILDFGQKKVLQCPSCGMLYGPGDPEEEASHLQFHGNMHAVIKFKGWKNENVVLMLDNGDRIITVLPNHPQYSTKKLKDIRRLVDQELGFQETIYSESKKRQVYMYVSVDKRILGVCIVEPITQAYRVIVEQSPLKTGNNDQRAWCCTTEPEAASCGISRIWVYKQARRMKVASKLLDSVRTTFLYGCTLLRSDLAFSDPTPDGRVFAANYTRTPEFLVYKYSV